MTRKLTATGLVVLSLAAIGGTGAAFAATSHSARPAAPSASYERSSHDKSAHDIARHGHAADHSADRADSSR